ncbi:MAG TPA: glycosyltransferase N-terminal domain-containing protein [Steroidobacteraceae bacterium]|nr:glycosyltransferase N-terminal domain-containing protein [Steroidobacteraceae bacterium]
MPRWLYSLLLYLLLPFAALWNAWRGWRTPALRSSLAERLAWRQAPRGDHPLWLHAASVGELRALSALHRQLHDLRMPMLVTVGTATGLTRARALFARDVRVTVQAACWDLPGAVSRFLAAVRPSAAVLVETELWPNLIAGAQSRGIALALVSARLSERSLRGYRRWAPGMMRDTVRAFAAIGAQSELDRNRLVQLGAPEDRVSVTGNLKFDLPLDADLQARGAALRARWAQGRPLWVAGSTHPGEEELLLHAHRRLLEVARQRAATPPLLAFAPRHPERFAGLARRLAADGWQVALAAGDRPAAAAAPDVVLINQMGVLLDWYAAADVAFVGGSLVPVGGHNLLEPAALARPVLTGPATFSAPDVAAALLASGGAVQVGDVESLLAALAAWLDDPAAAVQAGDQAAAAVAAHRGAAAHTRALLTARLFPSAPSASG